MAKTRLNMGMRDQLVRRAIAAVNKGVSSKAVDTAYGRAASLITAAVEKKFPPADMALLKKYEVARVNDCIRLISEHGRVSVFQYRSEEGPLVPSRYCSSRGFLETKQIALAVEKYEKAKDARKAKIEEIQRPYKALIQNSRYVEDVIEAWPASKAFAEKLIRTKSTAIIGISESDKKAIARSNLALAE